MSSMFKEKRRSWETAIGIFLLAVAAVFFARKFSSHWSQIANYPWDVHILPLVFSVVILIVYFVMTALGWRRVLGLFDQRLKALDAIKVYFLSSLGRYVPGKVMMFAGRVYFCQKRQISKTVALMSIVVEAAFSVLGATLAALLLLSFSLADFPQGYQLYFLVIPVLLLAIHPDIFNYLVNLALKLTGRQQNKLHLSYRKMLPSLSYYFLLWTVMGLAFFIFVYALLQGAALGLAPFLAGSFLLAWVIGFLAFFTPGGLGVREFVLFNILALKVPVASALVISIASRLWFSLTEVCSVIPVLFFKRRTDATL